VSGFGFAQLIVSRAAARKTRLFFFMEKLLFSAATDSVEFLLASFLPPAVARSLQTIDFREAWAMLRSGIALAGRGAILLWSFSGNDV
jgi:hypothetical protein